MSDSALNRGGGKKGIKKKETLKKKDKSPRGSINYYAAAKAFYTSKARFIRCIVRQLSLQICAFVSGCIVDAAYLLLH